MSYSKFYKQKYQYSSDNGKTWNDVVDDDGFKIYRKGALYESGLDSCGEKPSPEPTVEERTIYSDSFCNDYDYCKYQLSQIRYDGGEWITTASTLVVIEKNSINHCGYVPPTAQYRWNPLPIEEDSYCQEVIEECQRMKYTSVNNTVVKPTSAQTIDTRIYSNKYENNEGEIIFFDCPTIFGQDSFKETKFTNVILPSSLKVIGNWAFGNCSSLSSVTIPNSVTSIGVWAFGFCNRLTSVEIPDSVTSIGNAAFHDCSGLTSVTIPNSVTELGTSVFFLCTNLKNAVIGNGVTEIPNNTFYLCHSLTSVEIPNSVTSIGGCAFFYCNSLTSVGVKGSGASIEIPNSVTSISNNAFDNCTSLTSVEIPDSVTSIGSTAFGYCSGLTSITIPDSVTSISSHALFDCTSITTVVIPDSVTYLGKSAFARCTSLETLTLSKKLTSIGDDTIAGCSSLSDLYIDVRKEIFAAMPKGVGWKLYVPTSCTVHCSDGDYPITDF